ncbi:unnamed protein product, partial [Symbiodinium necroappetens]
KRKWDLEAQPCEQFQLLRQIPSLTKAQCRQILSVVREDGKGSRSMSRQSEVYKDVLPAFRQLRLQGKQAGEVSLPYLHLPTILDVKAAKCPCFQRALESAAQQNNLTMIFYSDECTPGNVLAPDTTRKSCMVYVSFLGLPTHSESAWITLSVIRSSAYRPCFKCANVVSLGGARPAGFVDIANSNTACLQSLSHTNLLDIRQQLVSLSSTTTKLQEAEKLLGWKLEELSSSFLTSPALSGWAELEDCAVDAMHAYWSNGVVAQELGLWFTALLDNCDLNLGHVQTYLKTGWNACPASGLFMSEILAWFSHNLWRKNHDFRGDARACLTVLPICVQFGEEILRGNVFSMDAALDSLKALNRVCLCILRSKTDVSHSKNLLLLQTDHMRKFDVAHGRQHRPKIHFGLHIREQCLRWRSLIDCFTCERKHRRFKHVACNVTGRAFAKSCLLEMATGDAAANPR